MNLSQIATLSLFNYCLLLTYYLINSNCINLYFKLTKLNTTGQRCDNTSKCDMWFRAHVKDDQIKDVIFYNGNNEDTLDGKKPKTKDPKRPGENLPLNYQFHDNRKEVEIVVQFADEGNIDVKVEKIRGIFQTFEITNNLKHLNHEEEIREIWQNTLRLDLQDSLTMKQFNPEPIQPNETIATLPNKRNITLTYGYEFKTNKIDCGTTTVSTTPPTTTSPITTTEIDTATTDIATITSTSTLSKEPSTLSTSQTSTEEPKPTSTIAPDAPDSTSSKQPTTNSILKDTATTDQQKIETTMTTTGSSSTMAEKSTLAIVTTPEKTSVPTPVQTTSKRSATSSEQPATTPNTHQQATATNSKPSTSSDAISMIPPITETTQTTMTLSTKPSTQTIVTDQSSDYSGTTSGTSPTAEDSTGSVSQSELPSALQTNRQTSTTNGTPSISTVPPNTETTQNAATLSRNPSNRTAVIDQSGYFNDTDNGTSQGKNDSTGSDSEEVEFPTALLVVLIMFILLGVGLVLAIVWHDKLYDTVVPFLISANPVN